MIIPDSILIRPATEADAPFVALGVVLALHSDPSRLDMEGVASICRRPDVLYSWSHALIAVTADACEGVPAGTPVGLCLCYDGAGYHDVRERTFALFAELPQPPSDADDAPDLDFEHMEDETQAGEYYVDSLAVLPAFRRRGIARRLLQAQLERGKKLGLPEATLLVDPDNPSAQSLYRQCGFCHHSEVYAFGQVFWKWRANLSKE